MSNEIKYDRTEQLLRSNVRIDVLATIDELNQYLLGNVTIEAATDAVRELTHKHLNKRRSTPQSKSTD
jgi:hypothetical protein